VIDDGSDDMGDMIIRNDESCFFALLITIIDCVIRSSAELLLLIRIVG